MHCSCYVLSAIPKLTNIYIGIEFKKDRFTLYRQ